MADDRPGENVRPDLIEHVKLVRKFVAGEISANEFETSYLRLVRDDPIIHGQPAFGIIDELFFHVDEYFDDPDFNMEERRSEQERLRSHAKAALDRLLNLPT